MLGVQGSGKENERLERRRSCKNVRVLAWSGSKVPRAIGPPFLTRTCPPPPAITGTQRTHLRPRPSRNRRCSRSWQTFIGVLGIRPNEVFIYRVGGIGGETVAATESFPSEATWEAVRC